MTKADLVDQVTSIGDLTRRDGEVIVDTLFDAVIGALKSGDKIEDSRLRQFSDPAAERTDGPQPEDWSQGRRSGQARFRSSSRRRSFAIR